VPDQSALGEWLRAIGEPGWQALRQLTREFVAWTVAPNTESATSGPTHNRAHLGTATTNVSRTGCVL